MKPNNNIKIPIWKQVEIRLQKITGGKLTPASGAGVIKGDVRFYFKGPSGIPCELVVEAKSTQKEKLNFQRNWLVILDQMSSPTQIVCLYLYVNNKICIYLVEESNLSEDYDDWVSKSFSFEELPETIKTREHLWKKHPETEILTLTKS